MAPIDYTVAIDAQLPWVIDLGTRPTALSGESRK
jgi:hypothetical protein